VNISDKHVNKLFLIVRKLRCECKSTLNCLSVVTLVFCSAMCSYDVPVATPQKVNNGHQTLC